MNRKPRTRQHARAVQALKRFHLARTVEAKLYRASVVAKYLGDGLQENAEMREELIKLRAQIERMQQERVALGKHVKTWVAGGRT